MDKIKEVLAFQMWGNSVQDYLLALVLFLAIIVAFRIFKILILKKLKKIALKTKMGIDDELIKLIEAIPGIFYYIVALYFPLKMLIPVSTALSVIDAIFIITIVYQAIKFAQAFLEYFLINLTKKDGHGEQAKTTFNGIRLIIKIILWITGILLILSNLGFNITSLIASLGIGGIAIALAVQNILGDVISSFSIYFDRPFEVGDFIVIGDHQGEVKRIGLKTTRLITLQGEELVISNNELTSARVQNFKKMKKRRVDLNLGIIYETSLPKLKRIPEIVKGIIDEIDGLEFFRAHFTNFGSYSLDFSISYYVLSGDMNEYLDKQQEVNFNILETFDKEGIEFAYPTQVEFEKELKVED